MPKSKLFLDIDDTILAECIPGAGMDLRPAALTQIEYLSKLFDCEWLTHWDQEDWENTVFSLYAGRRLENVEWAHWREVDDVDKAPYVLEHRDFFWLEDPLSTGDLDELSARNLIDRYIPVEPKGMWGFVRGINNLFTRAGITSAELEKIKAPISLFKEPCGDHFDWTFYEN